MEIIQAFVMSVMITGGNPPLQHLVDVYNQKEFCESVGTVLVEEIEKYPGLKARFRCMPITMKRGQIEALIEYGVRVPKERDFTWKAPQKRRD